MSLLEQPLEPSLDAPPAFGFSPVLENPLLLQHLASEDQQRFLTFGWGPSANPHHHFLHDAVSTQARIRPNEPAIEQAGTTTSYADLERRANEIAAELQRRGIGRGDMVGLFAERSTSLTAAMLGVLKTGAAYVPQHAGVAPKAQLEHIIGVTKMTVVLSPANLHPQLPSVDGVEILDIDADFASGNRNSNSNRNDGPAPVFGATPDDPCFVLFTSGTTGPPNGVVVTHGNVANVVYTEPGNLGIEPGMRVGQILSIAFDMAEWEIYGALGHGATLVIRDADIAKTAETVDVIISTPSILASIDATRCEQVKIVAVAGEPCPESLADEWSRFARFHNSCGPTETTIVNTVKPYAGPADQLTIGTPTPNNTVYVLDENLQALPIGEVGEMWAGGDCVTAGYLSNGERTDQLNADRYRDDPFLGGGRKMFRTRDLGRWTADGELEHYGRTDDQVKIRGFRVELDSVSTLLEAVPGCERAVTLKLDDRNLVAFVEPATVDPEQARQAVADNLPYYCVPAEVHALERLPRTDRGKIDKAALKTLTAQTPATGSEPRPAPEPPGRFRQMMKRREFKHYNRLVAIVTLINVVLAALMASGTIGLTATDLMVGNLTAAIVIRQQYVVNGLFWLATRAPTSWPLRLRWTLGKVYHFGGIHTSAATIATVWFLVALAQSTTAAVTQNPVIPTWVLGLNWSLAALLVGIVATALPFVRQKHHDRFEKVHRLGGWSALALFWVTTLAVTPIASWTMAALALVTFSVALPWMRLKKVPVEIDSPSDHVAIASFDYGHTPFAGSSTALSRNPLLEWHSFANVPIPDEDGFKLTISRAGDWTGRFIDDKPNHVWVKGTQTAGVANIEVLFNRVLYVATGSGIGPCLPHLFAAKVPADLVWATRNPVKTYGQGLVDKIMEAQPDAIVWDTDANGKPDMVELAFERALETGAEAVICISNPNLTWQVVEGMEQRGIPAYGAIWDS